MTNDLLLPLSVFGTNTLPRIIKTNVKFEQPARGIRPVRVDLSERSQSIDRLFGTVGRDFRRCEGAISRRVSRGRADRAQCAPPRHRLRRWNLRGLARQPVLADAWHRSFLGIDQARRAE